MPTGGLNYVANPMSFPVEDAYLLDNIIPRSYGAVVRKGWRYWMPKANSFAGEMRTIMPYQAADPDDDKLFCSPALDGDIYDITTQNTAPTLAKSTTTAPVVNGEWSYIQFVTPAGSYLLTVCLGAGYFIYSTAGGWVEVPLGGGAGQVSFPDATVMADLAFVFKWKSRVWFLKENSTVAYYLPVNSITGVTVAFDFGPLLQHGGPLAIGTSWTYDSGTGIDDSLIIVSFQGDVLLYEGTDPGSITTFALKGVWYAGRLPIGRRCFTHHGGNTLLATEYGVISIADLVAGRLQSPQLSDSFGYKVNPTLSRAVSSTITSRYWFLTVYPVEELLVLGSPLIDSLRGIRQSFNMNSLSNGWGTVSNMDLLCADKFKGQFIFGTRTGDVCQGYHGFRDGLSADGINLGVEVTGRIQGVFHGYGKDTMNKRMLRVKIYGFADGIPSFSVTYRAEYDLKALMTVSSPPIVATSTWDSGLWDVAIWDVGVSSYHKWIGVTGFGKKLSLQLAVRGAGNTTLTDFEALFETGLNL
jgi:hypothetical protein